LAASGGASGAGINETGGRLDRTSRNWARAGILRDSAASREGQTAQHAGCFQFFEWGFFNHWFLFLFGCLFFMGR
jgi:hypothetical protein